jgi:hypothetical protein
LEGKFARRRVKKYYKTIFYHLFDTALVNAYIYYKNVPIPGQQKVKHNAFRLILAESLATLQTTTILPEYDLEREILQTDMQQLHLPTQFTDSQRHYCYN